jgi:integrase
MQKQRGYVFRAGEWWYIKYRDTIIDTDPQSPTFNRTIRRQQVKKLVPVAPEDRRLKRPPESVLAEAEKFLRPLNEGTLTPESSQTLGQFVEEVYFPYAEGQKRASTLKTDYNRWNTHLRPRCGKMRLREFRTVTGEHLLQEIARQNELSKATLKQLKSLLSAIFKHAKRQGFIDGVNPMQDVSIPKARKCAPTYAYSLDEINRMLEVLDELSATIVAVAAFSGLRRSEIQGLRWSDYNGSSIQVQRSIWEGITDDTKTDASNGLVPVISVLARRLDKYRARLHGGPQPEASIFACAKGQALRLNNVLRLRVLPILNRCGKCRLSEDKHVGADHAYRRDESLPAWHGWHAFRRGLATNLHDLGIDDHTIKDILRHSSVTVTQRSYIKSLPKHSIEAMKTFDSSVAAVVHKRDMNPGKDSDRLVN